MATTVSNNLANAAAAPVFGNNSVPFAAPAAARTKRKQMPLRRRDSETVIWLDTIDGESMCVWSSRQGRSHVAKGPFIPLPSEVARSKRRDKEARRQQHRVLQARENRDALAAALKPTPAAVVKSSPAMIAAISALRAVVQAGRLAIEQIDEALIRAAIADPRNLGVRNASHARASDASASSQQQLAAPLGKRKRDADDDEAEMRKRRVVASVDGAGHRVVDIMQAMPGSFDWIPNDERPAEDEEPLEPAPARPIAGPKRVRFAPVVRSESGDAWPVPTNPTTTAVELGVSNEVEKLSDGLVAYIIAQVSLN
ncbi:hypothetical protein EXIGLDRAFT_761426 [Exidia glandulosa HHB12029]|uniref:Uncharacterized protein n=1 Tax=Exidia glandulosa HHB12029 TaxID=1314781 RepID=A0A165NDY7_EXIGL|nr:hypothetical protein EXIGLDRAFT_761426 [Exidia glandulosa HHB12029]